MEERLGEMRKGRRERMRKGAIVSSSLQGMTSWSSSIKIGFFQAYRMQYLKKDMSWCETECKNMCHWSECNKLKSLY